MTYSKKTTTIVWAVDGKWTERIGGIIMSFTSLVSIINILLIIVIVAVIYCLVSKIKMRKKEKIS